jgi:hypothetical protein
MSTATLIKTASITIGGSAPGKVRQFKAPGWSKELIDVSHLETESYFDEVGHPLARRGDLTLVAEWDAAEANIPTPATDPVAIVVAFQKPGDSVDTSKSFNGVVSNWEPEEVVVDGNRVMRAAFTIRATTGWATA